MAFEHGEGVWLAGKGDEEAVRVHPLFEGEQVILEIDGLSDTVLLQGGLSPVSIQAGVRYRFVKKVPEGAVPSKTCVEVIVK